MTWFESLTGFPESSPQKVRERITVAEEVLTSHVNGRSMRCGRLEIPSLAELRGRVAGTSTQRQGGRVSLREIVADAQSLHADDSNRGALFQVASQFNLLEMASPCLTPEHGVSIYENDHTQGPACAIAAGAGTIFRNYFAKVHAQDGQSAGSQIDCLAALGSALGNSGNRLWEMRNGYALASRSGLDEISHRLSSSTEGELDQLRARLRIGIQWDTQVTLGNCTHLVSQAYCSALPCSYTDCPFKLWENFARLVLEASYEATVCAAVLNSRIAGNRKLFLTLVGGGAFGNATNWIIEAIEYALKRYEHSNLDVAIVSHTSSNRGVQDLIGRLEQH